MSKINVIYDMFETKVSENPEARAVFDSRECFTRAELDAMAAAIEAMIPAGSKRVGIVMDHSVYMIAAIFAVLKSGAAYVPAEPFFPDERIDFMMKDAEVTVVITNEKYLSRFDGYATIAIDGSLGPVSQKTDRTAKADDLAYILYTSGSTGKPKGVSVKNYNVCHYVRAFKNEFDVDEKDVMLQYSVCSFDIFVEEVFTTILNGGVLAIPSDEDKKDINSLMAFVEANNVTEISGFPYLMLEMNHLENIPKSLRLLISGGDVLRESYVTNLAPKVAVYNTYGPSETTVCASYYNCSKGSALEDGTYPVGKPVLGSNIFIMDENMNVVPDGQVGELCIIGDGVSAGYIGDRKIENRAFVKKNDGTVIYRSGDLGYMLPDGNIAFLHRKDTQVMILGKRVEVTEVESVLLKCPEIEKGVVKAYTDENQLSYLVAYIVPGDGKLSVSVLKNEMEQFLPEYMIPEYFVRMNDLPLNANGKVDSKVLPVIMKEGLVA